MKKIILVLLVLIVITVGVILILGNVFGFIPIIAFNSTKINSPSLSNNEPKIPTSTSPPVAPLTTVIFDFDRGTPTVLEGYNTPLNQTSGGVTASFSSASDPSAFSIQSYKSTFYTLSQFSNKFLYDNKITRDILYIAFSQPITKINFTFASVEYEGPGHLENPSTLKLTAYINSIHSTSIDSVFANGNFSTSSFPEGTMSFNSGGKPFNLVKIELLHQVNGGTDFLIDNIVVITA